MVLANQLTCSHGRPCILLPTCLPIPARRTLLRSPSCARSTTLLRNCAGVSNLVPLRTSLPRMESSFLTAFYCGEALIHSPVAMYPLNCEISGSSHDSSSIFSTDIAAGVDLLCHKPDKLFCIIIHAYPLYFSKT